MGTLLLVDQGIGESFSGGPVLQGGKVVGVVTETDEQTTYAVAAAFFNPPGFLRSTRRDSAEPEGRGGGVGFRCVRAPQRQA